MKIQEGRSKIQEGRSNQEVPRIMILNLSTLPEVDKASGSTERKF
jgi:hypothetical protein